MCESVVKDPTRCLGSGAKGSVYLGFDQEGGHFVAIKELQGMFDGGDSEEASRVAAEISNEIILMKKAQHENLVRYLGARRADTVVQIVMEYVSGGSIGGLIKRHKRLREPVARSYVKDILSGLHYLHTVCHACHRDVKPENVLITPEGRCKLADFGASRTIETTKVLKTCVGTPSYMAPEVIAGEGYDYSADIWSLGSTLFAMLSGAPPYANVNNAMAIMFRIASSTEPPALPADVHVSEDLRQFLQLCFTRDKALRPSAGDLLSHAWLRGAADSSFHAPSAPITSPSALDAAASGTDTTLGSASAAAPANVSEARAPEREEGLDGSDPFSAITGSSKGDEYLRKCHYCHEGVALFTCDDCRLIGAHMPHNLCPTCWPVVHSHQRSESHRKRPLIVSGVSTRIQHDDPNGLLYANGQFAEMYAGEQSEWSCGKCGNMNDGPIAACDMCGHLR